MPIQIQLKEEEATYDSDPQVEAEFEGLDADTIPDTPKYEDVVADPEGQTAYSTKSLRWLGRRGRVLAAKLSRGFIDEGHIRFTGQSVEGPKDLALLSQVARNPTYEIHRVDFVKQGKVAGEMLHTSRLTGTTALFGSNKGAKQFIADMSKAKDAYKADGYYLMHNHPSSQSIRRTNAIYYPLYQLN